MDEVQSKRSIGKVRPSTKTAGTQLGASERVVRAIIMATFVSVLGFEAWLLWQVWQLF
jgi:hypothetical protein